MYVCHNTVIYPQYSSFDFEIAYYIFHAIFQNERFYEGHMREAELQVSGFNPNRSDRPQHVSFRKYKLTESTSM